MRENLSKACRDAVCDDVALFGFGLACVANFFTESRG
ncbi:hypothetical protein DFO83_101283 [Idiomarina loihiensis]|nr:hypothetical protein DFO83_101283 [Idiomarina loihiensis]TDP50649.1 hypothetical protein DET58_101283 [Idiomarina loihiensis]TDS25073.1 hypothetical protein DET62_101156 [Idiomarina sp. H2]